jgi:hypothetical protein
MRRVIRMAAMATALAATGCEVSGDRVSDGGPPDAATTPSAPFVLATTDDPDGLFVSVGTDRGLPVAVYAPDAADPTRIVVRWEGLAERAPSRRGAALAEGVESVRVLEGGAFHAMRRYVDGAFDRAGHPHVVLVDPESGSVSPLELIASNNAQRVTLFGDELSQVLGIETRGEAGSTGSVLAPATGERVRACEVRVFGGVACDAASFCTDGAPLRAQGRLEGSIECAWPRCAAVGASERGVVVDRVDVTGRHRELVEVVPGTNEATLLAAVPDDAVDLPYVDQFVGGARYDVATHRESGDALAVLVHDRDTGRCSRLTTVPDQWDAPQLDREGALAASRDVVLVTDGSSIWVIPRGR